MRRIRYVKIEQRPVNALLQAAGIIVGLIALAFAVIIGGFLLAGLIGLALIAWLVIYVRLWWLGRTARRKHNKEEFVEAEYRVIDQTETDDGTR